MMSVCTWEVGRPWLCSETTVAPPRALAISHFFSLSFSFSLNLSFLSYLSPASFSLTLYIYFLLTLSVQVFAFRGFSLAFSRLVNCMQEREIECVCEYIRESWVCARAVRPGQKIVLARFTYRERETPLSRTETLSFASANLIDCARCERARAVHIYL